MWYEWDDDDHLIRNYFNNSSGKSLNVASVCISFESLPAHLWSLIFCYGTFAFSDRCLFLAQILIVKEKKTKKRNYSSLWPSHIGHRFTKAYIFLPILYWHFYKNKTLLIISFILCAKNTRKHFESSPNKFYTMWYSHRTKNYSFNVLKYELEGRERIKERKQAYSEWDDIN